MYSQSKLYNAYVKSDLGCNVHVKAVSFVFMLLIVIVWYNVVIMFVWHCIFSTQLYSYNFLFYSMRLPAIMLTKIYSEKTFLFKSFCNK